MATLSEQRRSENESFNSLLDHQVWHITQVSLDESLQSELLSFSFGLRRQLWRLFSTPDFVFHCSVIKGGSHVRFAIIQDQKSYSCSPRSYDYCLCLYVICNLTASACAGQMRVIAERRPPHLGQECVRTCAVSRYCSWTICEAEVGTQIATRVRGLCGSNELKTH